MKNNYLVSFGEALIDFTPTPTGDYRPNAGGAAFNLAVCTAKLGTDTAFIGKLGKDSFGRLLLNTAENNGVDTCGIVLDEKRPTTHAFVTIDETGERDFIFCRNHGADVALSVQELNTSVLDRAFCFHFSGLALTGGSVKEVCLFALERAKRQGELISFDPNYRALLWDSREAFCKAVNAVLPYVDILKVSEEEAFMLTGAGDVKTALDKLSHIGLVLLTQGRDGASLQLNGVQRHVNGYKANTVDTTGAGDIFLGVFLAQLLKAGGTPYSISIDEAAMYCDRACMLAAQSTEKYGAIPSIPNFSL